MRLLNENGIVTSLVVDDSRPRVGSFADGWRSVSVVGPDGDETALEQVVDRDAILQLKAACHEVLVAEHVQDFAINLVMATQPGTKYAHDLANKYIRYGSSPRGAQALVECGRVLALMRSRLNLSTDDVREIAPAVLRHRIILNFDAHADGQTPETILSQIIENVSAAAVL